MSKVDALINDVPLSGAVFLDGEMSGDWTVLSQLGPKDFGEALDQDGRFIVYHFVRSGALRCSLGDGEEVLLEAGDLILFPHGDPHRLVGGKGAQEVDAKVAMAEPDAEGIHHVRLEQGGEGQSLYCGYLTLDRRPNLLLDSLPRMMVVRADDSAPWVRDSLQLIVTSLRSASSEMVRRMAEIIFVEGVKRHAEAAGETFLKGLSDPVVGASLARIHADPAAEISIDSLARAAGVSRTRFMDRFSRVAGEGPIAYRNALRLTRAGAQLQEGSRRIADIAYQAGYSSESSFSRAFKAHFGVAPSQWRSGQRA